MALEAQVAQWIRLLAHNQEVMSSNLIQAVTCSSRHLLLPSPRGTLIQGCSLRTHAFKNMRELKRTWMTKRKSRGPETYRYGRLLYPTKAE